MVRVESVVVKRDGLVRVESVVVKRDGLVRVESVVVKRDGLVRVESVVVKRDGVFFCLTNVKFLEKCLTWGSYGTCGQWFAYFLACNDPSCLSGSFPEVVRSEIGCVRADYSPHTLRGQGFPPEPQRSLTLPTSPKHWKYYLAALPCTL